MKLEDENDCTGEGGLKQREEKKFIGRAVRAATAFLPLSV
jgi:hypothetical protein